ncbi:uncharacterized protein LOC107965265 [Apis mellifera]|uniref:Uncharacterized protein LOC107965265 n=1 Tax=Apis mellifera TaxID=7460 RepID=A0A7M7IQ36_APIME|nr:uncharacterized protein LOC107965265 [Apis mellifera]|eukprot:XP_016770753.2 uncharacterized protein LOC107965265 [Apis mellifera]
MVSNLVYFIISIIISALAMRTSSETIETRELINSVQSPIIMAQNYPSMIKSMQDNSYDNDDRPCQIEYQITKKRAGKCIKLSHGVTGCVSGDYMNPFHPDCF